MISETLSQQQRVLSQAQVGFGYSRVAAHAEFEPDFLDATRRTRAHAPAYYTSREQQYKSPAYIENEALPRPMQTNDTAGPNIDPSGVQGLLLQDGLAVVEKRIREFREMRDRASDLGDWLCTSSSILYTLRMLKRTFTEYPENRLEQRSPRSSHLRFHNCDHYLPTPQHRRLYPRHEYVRRAQHECQPMGLLGYRAPAHGGHHHAVLNLGWRAEEFLGGVREALEWWVGQRLYGPR